MKKKLISAAVLASTAASVVLPYADTLTIDDKEIQLNATGDSLEDVDYQSNKDADFSNTTNVYAVIGEEFEVVIPKTIVLSGKEKKANYKVKVSGDIAGESKISVVPDEIFDLIANNKAAVPATVTQYGTEWDVDDVVAKKEVDGLITAESLTAGKWSGNFDFTIGFESGIVAGDQNMPVVLPEIGTSLSEMSYAQIQLIAQENKTADYNIKIGDTIKVGDIDAEIIKINDDSIEFMTIQKVVSDNTPQTTSTLDTGNNVVSYGPAAFYKYPQVNFGGVNSKEVSYVGSDIQTNVNNWFDVQDDSFKSSVMDVERTYDVATLNFNGSSYSEAITGSTTVTEKVYIPTKTETEDIYKKSVNHKSDFFWTATPYAFSGNSSHPYSLGNFYCGRLGGMSYYIGYNYCGACAMFTIG